MKNQNTNSFDELRNIYRKLDNEIVILNPFRYLPLFMIFDKLSCNYNLYYIKKVPFTSYFQENMNLTKEVTKSMLIKTKIGILLPLYISIDYYFTKNTNMNEFLSWHAICSFIVPYYFMNLTTKLISPLSFSKNYKYGKLKFNILTFTTYFILIHLFRTYKNLIFKEDTIKTEVIAEKEDKVEVKPLLKIIETKEQVLEKEVINEPVKYKVNPIRKIEKYNINLLFGERDVECVINKI